MHHVFDSQFDGWPTVPETVVVIGGGISAGHVALRLYSEGHRVHLVSRRALRQHQFDSDPGWLGWKYTERFAREEDPDQRRSLITTARHTGSVSPDIGRSLRRAIERDRIQWHEGGRSPSSVQRAIASNSRSLQRRFSPRIACCLRPDSIRGGPGDRWWMHWSPRRRFRARGAGTPWWIPRFAGIPVSLSRARLRNSNSVPVSRNIAGARRAGDRIVEAVRSDPGRVIEARRSI